MFCKLPPSLPFSSVYFLQPGAKHSKWVPDALCRPGQGGEEKLYADTSAEKTQLGKANRAEEAVGKPGVQEPTCKRFPGAPQKPSSSNGGHMEAPVQTRKALSTANQDSRHARGWGSGKRCVCLCSNLESPGRMWGLQLL